MGKLRLTTITRRIDPEGRAFWEGRLGEASIALYPTSPDRQGNERMRVCLTPMLRETALTQANGEMAEAKAARREGDGARANRHGAAARIARRKAEGIVELGGRD